MGFSYAQPISRSWTGVDRATLVRRTYGLVFLGVVITALGTVFAIAQPGVLTAAAQHPFIAVLLPIVPLIIVTRQPRVFPRNVMLTLLFTFAEGVAIAPLLVFYEARQPGIIVQAGALTLSTFAVLSLYAVASRRDFSAWGAFFITGLWVVIAASVLNFFFQSAFAATWISGCIVLVFSGLLVFDTWRLVRSGQYGPDDYVMAAVQIYLDLLNMFLAILSLLGNGNRRR